MASGDHRYDEIAPAQQGYDHSDGYTGNGTGGAKHSGGPAAIPDPKLVDTITDKALHFIDRCDARDFPFYLQISHYAVHLDIYYRQQTLDQVNAWKPGRKHNMPEFAAMTSDLDSAIGRVIDKLTERKLLNNTYLFFLSDNGGRNTIPGAQEPIEHRNAPLRDGKHSFYEGGIRVPFVVLGPGVQPGSVSRVPVTGLDIFPTMADLAGYSEPLPHNIDGGSMKSVLRSGGVGSVQRHRPYLVFHQGADRKPVSALRLGDMKLVKTWSESKVELFDLSKDLSEANDLSAAMPQKTQELHALLNGFLTEVGAETRRTKEK